MDGDAGHAGDVHGSRRLAAPNEPALVVVVRLDRDSYTVGEHSMVKIIVRTLMSPILNDRQF
jgi:hypothetical protein